VSAKGWRRGLQGRDRGTVPDQHPLSAMSLPYQIGTGWIGGLLPATMFAMNAESGNMFFGFRYAVVFAVITLIVGFFFFLKRAIGIS
jgi:hypothetical protein